MIDDTPFVAFGNEELAQKPSVKAGDKIRCLRCGEEHELHTGKDQHGNPSNLLLFYRCGDGLFLGAVVGVLVVKERM